MNRDDTYKMTREDVLRELELLPAWKLRAPVETALPKAIEIKQIEKDKVEKVEVVEVEKPVYEKTTGVAVTQYEITMSQDKHWAFANEKFTSDLSMPAGRMAIGLDIGGLQSMLLNNILHALQIEKPTTLQTQNLTDIKATIIVAMGENVAQALLNTQASLPDLQGKLQAMGNAQIIVTDDLAHLLAHPLDKAKVWQDMCLARAHLQKLRLENLQSQD